MTWALMFAVFVWLAQTVPRLCSVGALLPPTGPLSWEALVRCKICCWCTTMIRAVILEVSGWSVSVSATVSEQGVNTESGLGFGGGRRARPVSLALQWAPGPRGFFKEWWYRSPISAWFKFTLWTYLGYGNINSGLAYHVKYEYPYKHVHTNTLYVMWCWVDLVCEVRIPHLCRILPSCQTRWHSATYLVSPMALWASRVGTIIPNWWVRKGRAGELPKISKAAKGGVWTESRGLFLFLTPVHRLLSAPQTPSSLTWSSSPELVIQISPKQLATLKLVCSGRFRNNY